MAHGKEKTAGETQLNTQIHFAIDFEETCSVNGKRDTKVEASDPRMYEPEMMKVDIPTDQVVRTLGIKTPKKEVLTGNGALHGCSKVKLQQFCIKSYPKRMPSSSGFIQGSESLDMRLLPDIFLEVHLCNIPLGVNVAEDAAFPHRVDEYLLSKATLLGLNLDNENNA